ncbi:ribosome silencing factor [Sulfobacillus acidophilus]|uniref:Ribosomal silencing factor RsfS n=1 Tax=Sulfobacillus acidophilus TaxID=53633 RepID=A0ABS3AWV6_9FIRM|nr:ribosome silencing factor [Sulfobacillus acidophilus]
MTLKQHTYSSLKLAQKCAQLAAEKKAQNIVILDIAKLTSYADYLVICSATSIRQNLAICKHVQNELSELGHKTLGVEGTSDGNWVLCDYADVIFHSFFDEARQYYDLDGFWSDAPRIELEGKNAENSAALHQ